MLFNPNDSEFAKVAQAAEETLVPLAIGDPSISLISATNQSKGGVIRGTFTSGLTDIVVGRRPLSDFDQLVKDWRTAGGDQIRTEFQQAFESAK